jgi:flagellar biosynthesis/type III secretory pathway chaperone
MMRKLEQLIFALREELQHYGEMLARLDDQQELVMRRSAHGVLETVPRIQDQSAVLAQARETRIHLMKDLCVHLLLPEGSAFTDLIPKLPADYRPLMQALIQENNELLLRVQQRARQNHILLTCTVESMQRVINSLTSQRHSPVYGESGNVTPMPGSAPALYEAVC